MTSSQRQWLHSSVRHTGIVSSRVQTPLQFWLFQASVCNCLNCVRNCDDHSSLDFKSAVQYMKHFIYHFKSSFSKSNVSQGLEKLNKVKSTCLKHLAPFLSLLWHDNFSWVSKLQNYYQCTICFMTKSYFLQSSEIYKRNKKIKNWH